MTLPTDPTPSPKRYVALVADDHPAHQKHMENLLKQAGWTVKVSGNGAHALEMASNSHFDVLVLDQRMPLMLGLDIVRTLRANGNRTPVIMVTSVPNMQFQREAKEAGVAKVLSSPVDRGVFVTMVERAVLAEEAV